MVVAQRDYSFFAELASVRGSSHRNNYPRNLPVDMSTLTKRMFWQAPTDYHSASFMSVDEFSECWMRVNKNSDRGIRSEFIGYDLLGIDHEDENKFEHRIVFWFDN